MTRFAAKDVSVLHKLDSRHAPLAPDHFRWAGRLRRNEADLDQRRNEIVASGYANTIRAHVEDRKLQNPS